MTSQKNNSFDGIIPPEGKSRRSIRDIPLREKKNKIDELLKETAEFRAEHQHPRPAASAAVIDRREEREKSYLWIWIIVGLLVLGGLAIFFFRGAEVALSLKTETVAVDISAVSASEDADATSTLPYKVIPVQKEAVREVSATGAPTKVEKKASGTIIIYNNFSAAPQQLIATTRFESSGGLVYRIDKAVTVPGTKIVNGQSVPGSVEAVVYADVPGNLYNIGKADFVIPGFKGSAKYEGFYARSKTPLAGGFTGSMPQVSSDDLKAANADLESSLIAEALAELDAVKPAGHVIFKEGIRITYSSDVSPGSDGKATVTGTVTAEALVFDQAKVEKLIAESRNGETYRFDNLASLALEVQNADKVTSYISSPVLSLRLSGTLTTGQSFDREALKRALADKSKSQLQELLRMYPEITKVKATIHPFWSRSFPDNPEKIEIIVTKE